MAIKECRPKHPLKQSGNRIRQLAVNLEGCVFGNPGKWLLHCHTLAHQASGMKNMGGGRMKRVQLVLALLWSAAAFAGHELDGRDIGNGQALYKEHCASCHGAKLEGQPNWRRIGKDGILPAPPHDETGHTWHHDNRLLFDYTKLGGQALMETRGSTGFKSGMPGLGDTMSDDEIRDVLAYIRSTWPDRIRKIQADRNPPHEQ